MVIEVVVVVVKLNTVVVVVVVAGLIKVSGCRGTTSTSSSSRSGTDSIAVMQRIVFTSTSLVVSALLGPMKKSFEIGSLILEALLVLE